MLTPETLAAGAAIAYAVATLILMVNRSWRKADPAGYWSGLIWGATWALAFGLAAVSI